MNNIPNVDYPLKGAMPPRGAPAAAAPVAPSPAPEKIILPRCRLWLTPTERGTKPAGEMTPDEQRQYGPQIKNEKLAFYGEFRERLGGFLKDGGEEDGKRKMAQAVERYCADAKDIYGRLVEVAKYWEVRIIGDLDNCIIPQLDNLRVAPRFLKEDAAFIGRLLSKDPCIIPYVPDAFKKDRKTAMDAVRFSGSLLKHMDDEFRRDRAVVLAALENDGLALQYAGAGLRDDKEMALAAVRQNGLALQYVGEPLKRSEDWEVIMAAIGQNPQAIVYAGERLVGGKEHFSASWDEYPLFAREHGEHGAASAPAIPAPGAGVETRVDAKAILEIGLKFPRILDYFIEGHPVWDNEDFIWGRIGQTNSIPKRLGMNIRNNPGFVLALMEKRSKKLEDGRHDAYVLFNCAGGELRGDAAFLEKMLMFRMDVKLIADWIGKDDFFVQANFDDVDIRR